MQTVNQFKQPATFNGYALPKAAVDLIDAATLSGWVTGWQWSPEDFDEPFVKVAVGCPETGEQFKYTWHSRGAAEGKLRLFSKLYCKKHGHRWTDGMSLKEAKRRMQRS